MLGRRLSGDFRSRLQAHPHVREAEIQAKRQEENRVLREIDLARRQYAETHADEFTPPSLGESNTTW